MSSTGPRRAATSTRMWLAVCAGLLLGFVAAIAGTYAWNFFGRDGGLALSAPTVTAQVDLFRLRAGGEREMLLVPAGADADGEAALAHSLFPDEDPPRELASLFLANLSPNEPWQVDLTANPLAVRTQGSSAWSPLERLSAEKAKSLAPVQLLRLRALTDARGTVVVEPGSLRRVLYALPRRCRFDELPDVQWGMTTLVHDRLDLERIRHFREDPAAATVGR